LLGVTSDARLISFKATTPGTLDSSVAISGLQGGEQILGFDIRPSNGLLYLLTDAGRVYILDPATGMARLGPSLMPASALVGTTYGIDFSPTADALRVISDAERNLAVIVETGNTITANPLTRIGTETNSPAPDVIAIAYTSNFAGTTDTTLYDIDLATNTLLSQRPANNGVLTTIGPLAAGQTFAFAGGFDIAGGDDGLAVAALQPMAGGQSTLYRVNLSTGALTAVGAIGPVGTNRLSGLTIRLR
jgi:outer membrane protein assembly factor BamB